MLNLQQKAHYSLEEYRRGNGSPLSRMNPGSPSSPDEDDELAVLGGKTRYVTKAEPSSPRLAERSPTFQNPVVPLPLPATIHNSDCDPTLLNYLQSFQPRPNYSQQTNSQGYTSMEGVDSYTESVDVMSPSSMYGMSSAGTTSSQQESTSYMQSQPQTMHQPQQPMLEIPNNNSFPQYFNVYDYGNSGSMGNGGHSGAFAHSPLIDHTQPGMTLPHRKGSGSPETQNMQATWQDFVNGLAITM